jgi:phage gp45-like
MSFIRRKAEQARQATQREAVELRNLIRRLAISASEGGIWQLLGPDDEVMADVEVFQGIGYASRPESSSTGAEAVVVKIGGKLTHPVVIATRDESTRVDLDEDETAIFNSTAIVKVKADGTIEIGSHGGTFESLATKADVQTIRDELHKHHHTYVPGSNPATTTTGNPSVTSPTGTQKLKAE